MKILLLSRYEKKGASSRIRSYQYIPYLISRNFIVHKAPLFGDAYLECRFNKSKEFWKHVTVAFLRRVRLLLRSGRYNLLWVEKELFPWLPAIAERILYYFKVPYVVDYDDAVFHNYDRNPVPLISTFMGKKIDRVMKCSIMVVAGNEYLAERALQSGARRVEIVPSVIDLDRYPIPMPPSNEVFTIGWIGSPSTTKHLEVAAPALKKVCNGGRGRVVLIGAKEHPLIDTPVTIWSWSEETEVLDMHKFDVGIMPLPDSPWERGKCGFKLIQYMGCQLPVVGSPVGINKKIIIDGFNGYKAVGGDDWVQSLSKLRDDPALRRRMGSKGRKIVENSYSLQVTAPRICELLREAAENKSR